MIPTRPSEWRLCVENAAEKRQYHRLCFDI
nr:MAG TPA: hypothetical protein [Caudoviricetes sp.]